MVAHVLRFFPEYAEIGRRIRTGEVGKPLAANAYRLSEPADWNSWMQDPEQSGGTLVDDLVHDFDQLNDLFGSPRRVVAKAAPGKPGHVYAMVSYDGGEALVEGSAAMPSGYPFTAGLRVLCERGVLEHGFRSVSNGDGNIGADSESSLRIFPSRGEPEVVDLQSIDPWTAQIAYFAECIERERPPEHGTAAQACDALRVSLAAVRSLESGQAEPVSS
jgi:predicted dehydrogenase